jgi:hypothetical protein
VARTWNRRTKLVIVAVVIAAIAAAYVGGLWPERSRRLASEARMEDVRTRLSAAEAGLRAGHLLGRVLTVKELTVRQDYGLALERSSAFFHAVRQEAAQTSDARLRETLTGVLRRRDVITAGLAKADPATAGVFHDLELQLRVALDYEMPPSAATGP